MSYNMPDNSGKIHPFKFQIVTSVSHCRIWRYTPHVLLWPQTQRHLHKSSCNATGFMDSSAQWRPAPLTSVETVGSMLTLLLDTRFLKAIRKRSGTRATGDGEVSGLKFLSPLPQSDSRGIRNETLIVSGPIFQREIIPFECLVRSVVKCSLDNLYEDK